MKKNYFLLKLNFLFIVLLASGFRANAQGSVILTVSPDNCMNPIPNSGTYDTAGTMNSKPAYYKNANLRIVWTVAAWEVQGDDPGIGGVTWVTGWNNTANTPKPPATGWVANFGCFPITLSGDVSFTTSVESKSQPDKVFSDIYPNPAIKEFTIKEFTNEVQSKTIKEIKVEVYDVKGMLMLREKCKVVNGTTILKTNIEQLESGMYFVKLSDSDNAILYKQSFIKQ